jgi:hypothetical protein
MVELIPKSLKPNGVLLMTAPCGKDAVLVPWCRVYGGQRLPRLFAMFTVEKLEYWTKNQNNQWVVSSRELAFDFQPQHDPSDRHGCSYALGCFVLRKGGKS